MGECAAPQVGGREKDCRDASHRGASCQKDGEQRIGQKLTEGGAGGYAACQADGRGRAGTCASARGRVSRR